MIRIYNSKTYALEKTLNQKANGVRWLFESQKYGIIGGSGINGIRYWSLSDWSYKDLIWSNRAVGRVFITQDEKYLIGKQDWWTIFGVWDIETGNLISSFDSNIVGNVWIPLPESGAILIRDKEKNSLSILSALSGGKLIYKFDVCSTIDNYYGNLTLSGDSKTLYIDCKDGVIQKWGSVPHLP